ncbi:MAG: DUF11 domain-containing protein [Chloroflexi bacterium]|nr:DUF11 domain-containing protein [Chloroflexota bacterium]
MRKQYTGLFFVLVGLTIITLFSFGFEWETTAQAPALAEMQDRDGLFSSVSAQVSTAPDSQDTLRSRLVAIDTGRLEHVGSVGERVTLNLFDDASLIVVLDRVERNRSGSLTWVGRVEGVEHSILILVVRDGQVTGYVSTRHSQFSIEPVDDTTHLVRETREQIAADDDTVLVDSSLASTDVRAQATSPQYESFDSDGIIDVLVVHTAAVAPPGDPGVTSVIETGLAYLNQVLINSDVDIRFDLVHTAQTTYTEGADIFEDHMMLMSGSISDVEALRDEYHADVVTMIVDRGGASLGAIGGWTSVMGGTPAPFIWAHEWGHVLGGNHQWYDNGGGLITTAQYARGHCDELGPVKTLMVGGAGCPGPFSPVRPYFSNPDIVYSGTLAAVPLGVPIGTDGTCFFGDTGHYKCDADNHSYFNTQSRSIHDAFRRSEIRWTGAFSSDWNDPDNWEIVQGWQGAPIVVNRVPRTIDDVLIPLTGTVNISADAVARSIIIQDGASVTMNGDNTLSIYGPWTDQGGGFSATGGTVLFKGSGPQRISVGGAAATFHNLQIGEDTAQTVTLGGDLEVKNDLTIAGAASLDPVTCTLSVAGNWSDQAAGFQPMTSTVVFEGASQSVDITVTGILSFYNVVVDGAQVDFQDDVMVNNDLALVQDSVVDVATHVITVEGTLDASYGTLKQSKDTGNGTLVSFLHITNAAGDDKFYGVDVTMDGSMAATEVAIRQTPFGACTGQVGDPYMTRCFEITPALPGTATIKFWFAEANRNDQVANALELWHDGGGPTQVGDNYIYSETTAECQSQGGTACWFQASNVDTYQPFALGSGTTPQPDSTATVSTGGGSLSSDDGNVDLYVPTGAVIGTTTITVTSLTSPTQSTGELAFGGRALTVEATDASGTPVTAFAPPLLLRVSYSDADWQNKGITDETDLNLYRWSGSAWTPLLPCLGCSQDTVANLFEVRLDHLSEFAILGQILPALLSVTKEAETESQPRVALSSVVTYTIVIHNSGPGIAFNVLMTDPLPPEVSFGTQSEGTLLVPLPGSVYRWGPYDIAVDGAYTITFTADVTSSTGVEGNRVANIASVTAVNAPSDSGSAIFTIEGGDSFIYLPLVLRNWAGVQPNYPPVAEDDAYTTAPSATLNVAAPGVLDNDTDSNGDSLTAIQVNNPVNGSATLSANGSFVYSPDSGFIGVDSFDYMASDGTDTSNVATVVVTVTTVSVDPAPVVQSVQPANNTHTAPLQSDVRVTYDQPMDGSSVSTQTFAVHANQTGWVVGTYGVMGGQVTVTPSSPFKPGELVQASATTGMRNITGTAPLRSTVWQFHAATQGGTAVFIDSGQSLGTFYTNQVVWGDMDGDGTLDLVVANSGDQNMVYMNAGDGTFPISRTFGTGSDSTRSVALGDVDGDGDLDIAVANASGQSGVYLNAGDGTFPAANLLAPGPGGNQASSVALGDLDGDGDLDLALGQAARQNLIYWNEGDGTFGTYTSFDPTLDGTESVALGDVDEDGDLDIVVGKTVIGPYSGENTVHLNAGNGTFPVTHTFGTGSDWTSDIALGDMDADGDLDVAVGNLMQQNGVYLNAGDGTFPISQTFGTGSDRTNSVALGDMDGDGDLDIVVGNQGESDMVYLNGWSGTLDFGRAISTGSGSTDCAALGDVDGDGDLDVGTGNGNGLQSNEVYLNQD